MESQINFRFLVYRCVPNLQLNCDVRETGQQCFGQFFIGQNKLPFYPPFMTIHYECSNPLLFVTDCQGSTWFFHVI